MHVSMESEQVDPPMPPNSEVVPAPHIPEPVAPAGSVLAAIDDDAEEEVWPDNGGAGEEGADSVDAGATTEFPELTLHDLDEVDPKSTAFDFNTRVFKRRKHSILPFDEKGRARLLA